MSRRQNIELMAGQAGLQVHYISDAELAKLTLDNSDRVFFHLFYEWAALRTGAQLSHWMCNRVKVGHTLMRRLEKAFIARQCRRGVRKTAAIEQCQWANGDCGPQLFILGEELSGDGFVIAEQTEHDRSIVAQTVTA